MSKKLPKQISERLRKLMTGYELPHGTEFKDLEAFLAEELDNQKKEMIERIGSNQELLIKVEELINKAIDKLKLTGDPSVISSGAILILDDIIRAIK